MPKLASEPSIGRLAKDLGLTGRGNPVASIVQFAEAAVARIVNESPVQPSSLDTLRRIVANKYRLKIEVLESDADIDRIAAEYEVFHAHLKKLLIHEFLRGDTEGITVERETYDKVLFQYLAVVDARGERAIRAYFTTWHEIVHLVIHPPQLQFPGFRRCQPESESRKEPLESIVDNVAGILAFYAPLFRPVLERATANYGSLTFEAIEAARLEACSSASHFATAMGSIRVSPIPTMLVSLGMQLKAGERRSQRSGQEVFSFVPAPQPKLRILTAVPNDAAAQSIRLRRNMRVPSQSVLTAAFESGTSVYLDAIEDQSWWETQAEGHLPKLPLRVQALRRGQFVYGLIQPAKSVH